MMKKINEGLGEGFDSISQRIKETAVIIDRVPVSDTVDTVLTEEQLRNKANKLLNSPGKIQVHAFESLDELRKMVSTSLSLKGKLQDVGLSLDVTANKTDRVDARFMYYLIEWRSIDYCLQVARVPSLSEYARTTLGLLTPAITLLEKGVDTQTAAVSKATTDLKAATDSQTAAQAKEKAAQEALDVATRENTLTQNAYQDVPAAQRTGEIIKLLKDAEISLLKATQQHTSAAAALADANQSVVALTATLAAKNALLTAAKEALATANTQALAAIDIAKMQEFYHRFGTHYVKNASFGRQIVALVTIDRSEISDERKLKVAAGITSQYASAEGSIQKEMSKLANKLVVKINIASDGIKSTAMKSPTTMDELQETMLKLTSSENHTAAASLIDSQLDSYEDVLCAAGVPVPQVDYLFNRIRMANEVYEKLLELRSCAIRYYSARYFHQYPIGGSQSNPLIAGDGLQLEKDPHSRFLQSVFNSLRDNIAYLNNTIIRLQNDPFASIDNIIGPTPAPGAAYVPPAIKNIDVVERELDKVKVILDQRAKFRLVFVASSQICNRSPFPKTLFKFNAPPKTSGLFVSAHKGAAEQMANEIPVGDDVNGRPANIANEPVAAQNSLRWLPANDEFQVSLYQRRPAKIVKEKMCKVLTATRDQHEVAFTPEVALGGDSFCLDKGKTVTPAPNFDTTIRVWALNDQNLSEVPQEQRNFVKHAIEQKSLPDATDESNGKGCSIM